MDWSNCYNYAAYITLRSIDKSRANRIDAQTPKININFLVHFLLYTAPTHWKMFKPIIFP